MAQMLKKIWQDPVWSKVIAGAAPTAITAVVTYFLDWWPAIGAFISRCFEFALKQSSLPNWGALLLGILALPTVIFLAAAMWQTVFPPKPTSHSWRNYTMDLFFGLRWRWSYFDDGDIYDLHSFCPNCDFQVYPQDVSSYRIIDHIGFRCDSCGQFLGDFKESPHSLENKVRRFIQQKLRNGKWLTEQNAPSKA